MKITTIDWAIFSMYRLRRGTVEEIATNDQSSSPTGEKIPILISVKINIAPEAKSLKNQLLLKMRASYLATVPML
jgi:hypothetical protein